MKVTLCPFLAVFLFLQENEGYPVGGSSEPQRRQTSFLFCFVFCFFQEQVALGRTGSVYSFAVVTLKPKSFFYGAKQLGFNLRRQWGLKVCFQPSKYINIFVDFIVHVPQSTTVV